MEEDNFKRNDFYDANIMSALVHCCLAPSAREGRWLLRHNAVYSRGVYHEILFRKFADVVSCRWWAA